MRSGAPCTQVRAHESAAWDRPKMVAADGPIIKDGRIQLFDKPGLCMELNEDWVRQRLAPSEEWWG